jgi:hypothetical protein
MLTKMLPKKPFPLTLTASGGCIGLLILAEVARETILPVPLVRSALGPNRSKKNRATWRGGPTRFPQVQPAKIASLSFFGCFPYVRPEPVLVK